MRYGETTNHSTTLQQPAVRTLYCVVVLLVRLLNNLSFFCVTSIAIFYSTRMIRVKDNDLIKRQNQEQAHPSNSLRYEDLVK